MTTSILVPALVTVLVVVLVIVVYKIKHISKNDPLILRGNIASSTTYYNHSTANYNDANSSPSHSVTHDPNTLETRVEIQEDKQVNKNFDCLTSELSQLSNSPLLQLENFYMGPKFSSVIPEEEEEGEGEEEEEEEEEVEEEEVKDEEESNGHTLNPFTLSGQYPVSRVPLKFTDIDSPSVDKKPFPSEELSANDCDLYFLGLGSQVSTDSAYTKLDYLGNYGCLPDQRYAHSASQISTVGVRSQIGLLDDYRMDASQGTMDQMHKKMRKKRRTTTEKQKFSTDTKTVDSGVGQSLSPEKTLTPKRSSLTQDSTNTHLSLDHRETNLSRHWSVSDPRTVHQKHRPRRVTKATFQDVNVKNPSRTVGFHSQEVHNRDEHSIGFTQQKDAPIKTFASHTLPRQSTTRKEKLLPRHGYQKRSQATSTRYGAGHSDTLGSKEATRASINSTPARKHHCASIQELPKRDPLSSSVEYQQVRIIPKCVRPTATLQNCTSTGLVFTDDTNGFTIKIDEGSIAEGDTITIDIGVALYGPFVYPKGMRPLSPIFWICVRENDSYEFKKPVRITLQHFLSIYSEEERAKMGVCFAKACHNLNPARKYTFHRAAEKQLFKPKLRHGTIAANHFCFQCIVGNISELTLRNSNFCLFGTLPTTFVYDQPMYVFFYVTFFLSACLETVRRQIVSSHELANCKHREVRTEFQFSKDGLSDAAITIHFPRALPGGWQLGIEFKQKVSCITALFGPENTMVINVSRD